MTMVARRQSGFTLIELMIVVAVLGIVVALAYNTYQRQVDNSRRADAQTSLVNISQRLERCYTETNNYEECVANGADTTWESEDGHYQIGISNLARSTFTLTATPQGFHASRDGARCATLTLRHTGQRDATGTQAEDCWGG